MTTWISTDIALSSGAVIWNDTQATHLIRIWPNAAKTTWRLRLWPVTDGEVLGEPTTQLFATDQAAWEAVWSITYGGYDHFVAEAVYGDCADVLAERRGTILAWLDCRRPEVSCWKARSSEWRGAVVYNTDDKWPQGRKAKKKKSVELVRRIFGIDLPDDVTDAFLIGRWFLLKEAYEARDRSKPVQRKRRARKAKSGGGRVRKRGCVVRQ